MERKIEPGHVIVQGKYKLVRHLSRGGQADVWEAEQTGIAGFRKSVVLKLLRSDRDFTSEAQRVLLQEARLAAQLQHPDIVEIYDVGQEDDIVYIAMERIDGADLRVVMDRCWASWKRPLPWPLAVRFGARIARALQHAHQKCGMDGRSLGLVHRDLKPANVILAREGFLKLIDFGIAKSYNITQKNSEVLKGTAAYMSPEQILGQALDGRSDIFSLGSILYELCTHIRPFEPTEGGMGAQIFAVVDHHQPPMRNHRPDIPEALDAIVARMLHKDREHRFADARQTYRALEQLLRAHQIFLEQDDLAEFFGDLISGQAIQGEHFSPPHDRAYLLGTEVALESSAPSARTLWDARSADDWAASTQIESSSGDDWNAAPYTQHPAPNAPRDGTPSHPSSPQISAAPPAQDWEVATQIAPSWAIQSPEPSAPTTPSLENTLPDDESAMASWSEIKAVSLPLFAEATAEEPSYQPAEEPSYQPTASKRPTHRPKPPPSDDRTHIEIQSFGVLEAIQPPAFLVASPQPHPSPFHQAASEDGLPALDRPSALLRPTPSTKELDSFTPLQELPTQEMLPVRNLLKQEAPPRSPKSFESSEFRATSPTPKSKGRAFLWWSLGLIVLLGSLALWLWGT
ncbi:protein kinase [Myxococcota bacterium]|nr:protein kinase [Myxococcota bacterium]